MKTSVTELPNSRARVDVEVPGRLTDEEDELLRNLAELRGEEVAGPQEKGVFSRLRSAFQ